MRPLRRGDLDTIGGYRLLRRLGAGGMGVVYLARSPGGTPVALKVIHAQYAADPGFRTRFRREAEVASRLSGRWLVPVVAAAPEEREPWLATHFVPGPALAEAVGTYGPLPARTVRLLGVRLAEALAEVHAAGLVHRDVKPGNVLLALDGPRLIDFGIARISGATALTESGAMLGTPGYLPPERMPTGGGELDSRQDVFALGGVLAYAATGRHPFGTGPAAAVLYRTVHEEPDLDGVPDDLLPLLTTCLAKDPADRPEAREAYEALRRATTEGRACPDPRTGDRDTEADWLPASLTRLVAARSAEVLTLPGPAVTEADPDRPAGKPEADDAADGDGPRPTTPLTRAPDGAASTPAEGSPATPTDGSPSRRRLLRLASAAGVCAVGGGVAAWAVPRLTGRGAGPGSGLPRHVIGLHADLTGPERAAGRAQERGMRLALAEHNSRADRPFDLALRVRDDRGEERGAERVAEGYAAEPEVLAVIGPTGRTGTRAVVARYQKSLLPLVSVSCGASFSARRERVFVQLRQDETNLEPPLLHYLNNVSHDRRTAVVDDQAAGRVSDRAAETLTRLLHGTPTAHSVATDSADFGPVAAAVRAANSDAVVYCGDSPRRAARCARALSEVGFRGTRMARQPVLQREFLTDAGEAGEGWLIATTYADPAELPGAAKFVAAYRARFEQSDIPPYAVESYDALRFVAHTMGGLAARGVERGALVSRLRDVTYKGLARTIDFDGATDELVSASGLFLHRVEDGAARFLGRYDEVKEA